MRRNRKERHALLVRREIAQKHTTVSRVSQEIFDLMRRRRLATGRLARANQRRKIAALNERYRCNGWVTHARDAKYRKNYEDLRRNELGIDLFGNLSDWNIK